MSFSQGDSFNEGNLFTNATYSPSEYYSYDGVSSRKSFILVAPVCQVRVDCDKSFRNDLHVKFYKADIIGDYRISDWVLLKSEDLNDDAETYRGNFTGGEEEHDTAAMAWGLECEPYADGFLADDKATFTVSFTSCNYAQNSGGLSSTSFVYEDDFKGKPLLILKNGLRLITTGREITSIHPREYVQFDKGTVIEPGDEVVFGI